jgi:hypothetical protein
VGCHKRYHDAGNDKEQQPLHVLKALPAPVMLEAAVAPWVAGTLRKVPTVLRLTAAATAAAFCLVASACGGSSGSAVANLPATTAATSTGASTTAETPAAQERDLLAFSSCMRRHGVAAFPDPARNDNGSYGFSADVGQLRKLVRGAQKAFNTCAPLLATSGILSARNIEKFQQQMLTYARCMRNHGVSDFPDPNASGRFAGQLKSLDRTTPAFQAAAGTCRPVLSKALGAFTVGG